MTVYNGSSDNDTFTGTSGFDTFNMADGGSDTVTSGGGSDIFNFGASFDITDRINGGGASTLNLAGDYSAGLNVTTTMMRGFAYLNLQDGYAYHLTFANGVVGAGSSMTVHASGGSYLDASADVIGGNYLVSFSGGDATFLGGAGVDTVTVNSSYDLVTDHLDGGDGQDVLNIHNGGNFNLTGGQVSDFDRFSLYGSARYKFKVGEGVVGQGDTLYLIGSEQSLQVRFDGHLETDGAFHIDGQGYYGYRTGKFLGGAGDDYIAWGYGSTIMGGRGGDTMLGDFFIYRSVWDSSPNNPDHIFNFGSAARIDLHAIDADTTTRGNQAFHVVSSFTHTPGEVTVHSTGSTTADILADVNGDGGADMVIEVSGTDVASYNNFIL